MRTSSLRVRVTVAVLVLLVVTLLVLSGVVEIILGGRLRADLRARLVDRAVAARALDGSLAPQALADRLAGDGVTAELRAGDGRVVVGRSGPATSRPPPPRSAKRPGPQPAIRHEGELLTLDQPLGQGQTLVLQASLADVDRTLARLRVVDLLVSLALLVVVGLVLTRVVGAALAPLDRMTRTAREIAAGSRGSRLLPSNPSTEIGRTAAAFDEMLDALEVALTTAEASERGMRDFLSDASHELRTPVAGLQASAETLLRTDPDREQREDLAVAMVRESRRAGRLVNDLLCAARLDADPAVAPEEEEPCDLVAVTAEAIATLRRRAPAVDVQLVTDDHVVVRTPRDQMLQVIGNLLDNAVTAGGPSGSVHVEVRSTGDEAQLSISDDGPGIPPPDRQRVFERFVRLDPSRSRAGGGAGLGLAIVRAMVVRHGGQVTCEERPGGRAGARFVVRLPSA
jgi:two-component system OmpR family sensor kinase